LSTSGARRRSSNCAASAGVAGSYWYDGRSYESDITRGLLIWALSDQAVAGAKRLGHLNQRTQEFTIG
jgi:hypothetical protein